MIEVKILSCRSAQRYAVRQRVVAAKSELQSQDPYLEISIMELKDWAHIEPYTQILAAPSLVVNERLVCEGRFPSRKEVLDWLRSELISERL
jgi:Thioredoxin domain